MSQEASKGQGSGDEASSARPAQGSGRTITSATHGELLREACDPIARGTRVDPGTRGAPRPSPMPHPASAALTPDRDHLHDEAAALFQPRTARKLTRENGREITKNLTGFIQVLLAWDRAERAAQPKELDHE